MNLKGKLVVDATEDLLFDVIDADVRKGVPLNPTSCAAVLGCLRETKATEVIIQPGTAYVLMGKTWKRYLVSNKLKIAEAVIDNGGKFPTGTYVLRAPTGKRKLGAKKPTGPKVVKGRQRYFAHTTISVRPTVVKDS